MSSFCISSFLANLYLRVKQKDGKEQSSQYKKLFVDYRD